MRINIYNDYKIFNAGKEKNVSQLIALIKLSSANVTLDLVDCLIDYPATSYLIDEVLKQLKLKKAQGKKKELNIELDLTLDNEKLILSWLFYGSKEFNWIEEPRDISIETIKGKIKKYLKANSITINIILKNDDKSIFKEIAL